mgnify:CR=1 FL=1
MLLQICKGTKVAMGEIGQVVEAFFSFPGRPMEGKERDSAPQVWNSVHAPGYVRRTSHVLCSEYFIGLLFRPGWRIQFFPLFQMIGSNFNLYTQIQNFLLSQVRFILYFRQQQKGFIPIRKHFFTIWHSGSDWSFDE